MPPESPAARPPLVSVVVPTYNRRELLRRTLESLADQTVPTARFEVVVADDGSTDDTRAMVESFKDRLRIQYYYQEDDGFRAARARNEGARLAEAPVLAFLDTGVLAGPGYVESLHGAHHRAADGGADRTDLAILGYTYGYNRFDPFPGLGELLAGLSPQQAVDRLGADPRFRDMRHERFAQVEFELNRLVAPWFLFWTMNVSVTAAAFWAVSGFDEDFRGWGLEDVELGYRLARHGVRIDVARAAWAVDVPHERSTGTDSTSVLRNAELFLAKHPEPVPEMLWARYAHASRASVEDMCRELARWTEDCRDRDVSPELAEARAGIAGDGSSRPRIAVFGCGHGVPSGWPPCTLVDFDLELLRSAPSDYGRHTLIHAIGLRTPCPDGAFDLVIVSSRLAGLWERWGQDVLAEALRIGATVSVPFLDADAAGRTT